MLYVCEVFKQGPVSPEITGAGKGFTVTVVETGADEPHPFATTLTVAEPEKPAAQVTVPVVPVPATEFPAPVTDHV